MVGLAVHWCTSIDFLLLVPPRPDLREAEQDQCL